MNKTVTILASILFLAGCASTNSYQEGNYLDLTDDREAVNNYFNLNRQMFPSYPPDAARKGLTGCVNLAYVIDEEGKPQNIKIIRSYPEGVFDKNALAAMRNFRWTPIDGAPIQPVATTTQLEFHIEGVSDAKTQEACKAT